MRNFELLALPASGKSWLLEHRTELFDSPCLIKVNDLRLGSKSFYSFIGLFTNLKLAQRLFKLYSFNRKSIGIMRFLSKAAVVFHRKGVLNVRGTNGSVCLDEGPLQALWALSHKFELSDYNKKIVEQIYIETFSETTVIYVSVTKKNWKERCNTRLRRHPISEYNGDLLLKARSWQAYLCLLARKNSSLKLVTNN